MNSGLFGLVSNERTLHEPVAQRVDDAGASQGYVHAKQEYSPGGQRIVSRTESGQDVLLAEEYDEIMKQVESS